MITRPQLQRTAVAGAVLIGLSFTACEPTPAVPGDVEHQHAGRDMGVVSDNSVNTPALTNRELAALRRVTADFHDLDRARESGYEVLVTHPETGAECLSHPTDGSMGFHYLNPNLVDGEVVVDAPEVVIYEQGPNGKPRLVAVEYLIPFEIRSEEAPPPVLFGQEFVENHTFDLWALHVWVWRHNPSGIFADWNPRVSCEG